MSSVLPLESPEDWEVRRLGSVVTRSKEANQADLQPLSVFLDQGVVPRTSRDDNHNRLGADMAKYLVVRPGDLVFNKLRTWQGGLGVSSFEGVVSPAYFVCRPGPKIEPRFLHHLLRSSVYLAELTRLSKFMPPSQFDIGWDELKTLPVLVPPLRQQRAIGDFLDRETARIDTLVARKQRLIELLGEQLQVTIDAEVESASWRKMSLKHCSVVRVSNVDKKVYDGEVPVRLINYTDVSYGDRLRPSDELMAATASPQQIRQFRLQPGDVIITKDSETPEDIGIAAFVEESADDLVCGYHLAVIRPDKSKVDGRFLCYVMRSKQMREHLALLARGVTRFGLRLDEIRSAPCQFPDLVTQREIAARLDRYCTNVESVIGRQQRSIDLLRELRQALSTTVVTGELEVAA